MKFADINDYQEKLLSGMTDACSLLYKNKGIKIKIIDYSFGPFYDEYNSYGSDIKIEINGKIHGSTSAALNSKTLEDKDETLNMAVSNLQIVDSKNRLIFGNVDLQNKTREELEKLYYKVSEEKGITVCIATCLYGEGKYEKRF